MEQPSIDQPGFRNMLARAVVAPLLIMALLAGVLLWQIDSYRVATRAVINSDRTIALANQLQRLLVDMETGLRGYLLTGVDSFLDPYNQALPQIQPAIGALNTRVTAEPDQTERLKQILQQYAQWQQYANSVLQLRKSGGDYASVVASGAGKQIMDNNRAQMEAFIQSEQDMRDTLAEDAQRVAQIVIYTSLGLALLVGALLAFYSRRQLVLLSRSYNQAIALARDRADEVAEQRERLQVTLASIGDGVVVTDIAGKVTFTNTVAQALTGWAQAEAQGQPLEQVFAIINEETRRQAENPVAKVLREGTIVGLANHTILLARHGAEVPIDDSAAPIRDMSGKIVGVVLVFRDIAERKQAERAQADLTAQIAKERQRLNNIITSVPGIVWESWGQPNNADQSIDFVSDYVETLLGYSVQEWLQTPNFWLTIVHPDDRERAMNQAAATFASLQPGLNQFRWITRDGRIVWVETHSSAIVNSAGQPIGMRGVTMDITERKRAEEAIQQSEERFRLVFENAPIGICLGRDGQVLYGNQALANMFGYADIEELRGLPLIELVAPSMRDAQADQARQREQGAPAPQSYETIGLRKDGVLFPYAVDVDRVMLPDGPAVVAFCIDISERQQADKALRASEQRYRDLADTMPLVVWTARPNGELDYFNQRWFDYTGRTFEQSQGSGWQLVLHPDDTQNGLQRWNESIGTGRPYEIEYRWQRADGVYRWHLGRARAVRDASGQIAYWVGTSTDIEEQKQAEEQQRLLAEASVLLVSSLDYEPMLNQLTRLAVPRLADWCAIHILEDGEIRRLAFTHSDPLIQAQVGDRPERYPLDPSARHIVSHVLRTGEPELYSNVPDRLLVEAARDDEHLRTLRMLVFRSYMCLPMVARGHTLGTITLATAESGRRYGQAELAFGEDLASRAAIALDNARLYHDAQAAVRARDQFLSIASHELKTPLTSLMGYVDLMQRRAARAGEQSERDQRAIRVVGEQAARLNKLIGALLDLSRIETGQLSIERGLVDLNALARRLVEETQPTTDRHTITFSGDDQPVMLLGDELRLEQVIQNLIQNAIKYSPVGGTVAVQIERQGANAYVRVSDQGIGIPATALPQLFRRFYRAPNADSQHISGMGIGLYVVKEIIELHGGTVEAASQEGQGSTFTLCLPLLISDDRRKMKVE
jgi:PAS domain S-box-containing protein